MTKRLCQIKMSTFEDSIQIQIDTHVGQLATRELHVQDFMS